MQIDFGDFSLDTGLFELRKNNSVVAVEPKVLDFLVYLASNPDRVVTKDDVVDTIWDGRIVSEATISGCVKAARRAVDDDGQSQRVIKTVHGRGFRFVATVSNQPVATRLPKSTAQVFVQPSLLVLPVQVVGGPETQALAAVIGNRLINVLVRVPFLTVISARAAAALQNASPEELRHNVGNGFVLDISLTEVADHIAASLQLSDIASASTVWAHQFDIGMGETAETEFLKQSLPWIEPALAKAIHDMLIADPAATGSKPLLIQALGTMSIQGWHNSSFSQAEVLLRKAVALDPNFAMANATLALVLALGQKVGFAAPSAELVREAVEFADTALAIDDTDSSILGLAGCALADAGEVSRAIPILKRAIQANPDNAQALAAMGSAHLHQKNYDAAREALEKSVAISPMDKRLVIWRSVLAMVLMKQDNLDLALDHATQAVEADDRTYFSRITLTAIHVARGDTQSASISLADCKRLKPELSLAEVSAVVGKHLGNKIMNLTP